MTTVIQATARCNQSMQKSISVHATCQPWSTSVIGATSVSLEQEPEAIIRIGSTGWTIQY